MKKFLSIISVITVLTVLFTACNGNKPLKNTATENTTTEISSTEKTNINIAVLKGPTGIGASKLMEMNENGETANKYNFTVATSPEQITAKLVSGELDIAFLPTNAVATLFNKTNGGVKLLGINTLGVLYILEKGNSVNTVSDLKGKTVLTSGKGTVAEFTLNYILKKNGIDPEKDIDIQYVSEHSEVSSKAIAGTADIVMLPEPFVTSVLLQDKDFKIKIDLTEEWKKTENTDLSMGAVAVRTQFLNNNKEAVADFYREYEESVKITVTDTEGASALTEKYGIMPAETAKQAIPNCNIVFIAGNEMKKSAEQFLKIVYSSDASLIGGKMPDEDFYYTAQ